MPIIKKDQTLPPQPVIVLVYGDPGTSKTSLSNTCHNPLNLDFDRGYKRSYGKVDSLQLTEGWKEVEQELAAGSFDAYDTIVTDTAKGALDDFLMAYVCEKDYKLRTNKLKAFGELGEQFKAFVNQLRLKGKDLFIIAHAKTEEDGDIKRKVPDVTGSSNALLLRIADQVGYLSMRNGKRVLTFNPSDTTVGKNVAGLPDLVLPPHTSPEWNGFAGREIIQRVKDSLTAMSAEQTKALELVKSLQEKVDNSELSDEGLKAVYNEILAQPEHIKKQLVVYFNQHLKKVEWKANKETKCFEPVNPPAPVQAEASEEKKADLFEPVEAK